MSRTNTVRPITIVVPVYGDLDSLSTCIDSLIENVDTSIHSVLLIDDRGPDSDEIHDAVMRQLNGRTGFRLERNSRNLGFVGTCNRAAVELDASGNDLLFLNSDTRTTAGFLDELAAVLAQSPMNAAVCPRSNNATIASLPFRLRDPSVGRDPERTIAVFTALRLALPRFSVSPVSMGFCLLVRREVVAAFGLFDPRFAPGYGEENDFCLRVAARGYRSLIANRALVLHEGSRSFVGLRRDVLRARHEAIVSRRYPDYRSAVARYLWSGADVADLFADVLVPSDGAPHVLAIVESDADPVWAAIESQHGRHELHLTIATAGEYRPGRLRRREITSRLAAVTGVFDVALGSSELGRDALRVADRSAPRWMFVAGSAATSRFADRILSPEDLSDADNLGRLILAQIAAEVDLDRLRERHREFAPANAPLSDLAVPVPSAARRARQVAVDRIPTLAITAQWAAFGIGARLRARFSRRARL